MRIFFQTGSIPTRAAKRLKEQQGLKESEARRVTAIVLGYRNWADLENLLKTEPASPLDEDCDAVTFRQRRLYQVNQLQTSGVDLQGKTPADVLAAWQPSAAHPQTPVTPNQAKDDYQPRKFLEAMLILDKYPNAPSEPFAQTLMCGVRHADEPEWLEMATYVAANQVSLPQKQSKALGRMMLESLVERGVPLAMFNLSTSLMLGDGGPKDEKRAGDLLERLARLESAPAELRAQANSRLGGIYAGGLRRGTDELKALSLWEQSAESGDAEAGFNAGLFHEQGLGGKPENKERAAYFYRLAADKSHVMASTNLGLLLLGRPDLSTDKNEAESRLAYSAKKGDIPAIEALKAFNQHIKNVMRDFDSGQFPAGAVREAQKNLSGPAKGAPTTPPPKTAPNRTRASKRK